MDAVERQRRIAEAEDALHNLMIGKSAVEIVADGYSTKYTPADAPRLRAYLAELRGGQVQAVRIASSKGFCS